jgi:hypothetical protein
MYFDTQAEDAPVHPSRAEVTINRIADLRLPAKQRLRKLLVDLFSIYTNNDYEANVKRISDYFEIMPDSILFMPEHRSNDENFVEQLSQSMNASKKCHIEIIRTQDLIECSGGKQASSYELRSIDLETFEQLVNEYVTRYNTQKNWKHATLTPAIEVLNANFPTLSLNLVNGMSQGSFDYPCWYIEGTPQDQLPMQAADIQAIQTHPTFEADGIHDNKVDFIKDETHYVDGVITTSGKFIFTMGNVNAFVQRFHANPAHDGTSSNSSSRKVSPSFNTGSPLSLPVPTDLSQPPSDQGKGKSASQSGNSDKNGCSIS